MNKVILAGRLVRDPEIRYTQGAKQMAVARYTLAVDRRNRRTLTDGKEEQSTDFINCVSFDRTAEFAEKYLRKGTKILVTGRIQTGSYTNKDGQRIYTTDIVVEETEFMESKNGSEGDTTRRTNGSGSSDVSGFMDIPDDASGEGLPFV